MVTSPNVSSLPLSPNQQQQQQQAGPQFQSINNNITVNVNLNLTTTGASGVDAADEQQKQQLAQQIMQVAAHNLQQQVNGSRSTPFTQFMTDQQIQPPTFAPTGNNIANPNLQNQHTAHPQQRRNAQSNQHQMPIQTTIIQNAGGASNIVPNVAVRMPSQAQQQPVRPGSAAKRSLNQQRSGFAQQMQIQPQQQSALLGVQASNPMAPDGLFVRGTVAASQNNQNEMTPSQQARIRQGNPAMRSVSSLAAPINSSTNSLMHLQSNGQQQPVIKDKMRQKLFILQQDEHQQQLKQQSLNGHQNKTKVISSNQTGSVGQQVQTFNTPHQLQSKASDLTQMRQFQQQQVNSKTMTPTKQNELQKNLLNSNHLVGGNNAFLVNTRHAASSEGSPAKIQLQQNAPFGVFVPPAINNPTSFKGFSMAGKPVQIKHAFSHEASQLNQSNQRKSVIKQDISNASKQASSMTNFNNNTNTQSQKFIDTITRVAQLQNQLEAYDQIPQSMSSKPILDLHQMLQTENQVQNQFRNRKNTETYNFQQHNGSNNFSSQSQTSTFKRPGRKVVQRPPSAKQSHQSSAGAGSTKSYKQQSLISFKNNNNSQNSNQRHQNPLQSTSITLRQRGGNGAVQQQQAMLHQMTSSQFQQMQAHQQQRAAFYNFIEKRASVQELYDGAVKQNQQQQQQTLSSQGQITTKLSNSYRDRQQQQPSQPQLTTSQSYREFKGLITTTNIATDSSITNQQPQNSSSHQQNPQMPMPTFIQKMGTSSTLANEFQKRQNNALVSQGQIVQPSAMIDPTATQKFQAQLAGSFDFQQKNIAIAVAKQASVLKSQDASMSDSMIPGEALPQQQQQLLETQLALIADKHDMLSAIRVQEENDALEQIKVSTPTSGGVASQIMFLHQPSPAQKAKAYSIQAQASLKAKQQPVGNLTQPILTSKRRPSHQRVPSTKQSIDQEAPRLDDPRNARSDPISYAPTGMAEQRNASEYASLAVHSPSTNAARIGSAEPSGALAAKVNANNSDTNSVCEQSKKPMKRPNRPQRPKSGIPANRAPFRPAGVAQPTEMLSSKRNQNAGIIFSTAAGRPASMKKSGTFARTGASLDREETGVISQQKYGSNQKKNAAKDEADESGDDDSYADYDDEASYYSDDANDDEENVKEKLEFDEAKDYSPQKNSSYLLTQQTHKEVAVTEESKGGLTGLLFDRPRMTSNIAANKTIEPAEQKLSEPTMLREEQKTEPRLKNYAAKDDKKYSRFDTIDKPRDSVPAPQKANFVRNPTMGDDDVDLDVRLATDEEELSVGYLDEDNEDDEVVGDKEHGNVAEGEIQKQVSPKPRSQPNSQLTFTSIKSPNVHKRTVKLKVQDPPSITYSQDRSQQSQPHVKPQLGLSNSVKVIESKNSYVESSNSKRSLQLSDSCPKENLVRQLYQRPGVLKSIEGLNSRLRDMSVKRSYEGDAESAANQYQMFNGSHRVLVNDESINTIAAEILESQQRTDPYNPTDPFTQQRPVYLCKSPFAGRPPTVYFTYPPGIADRDKQVENNYRQVEKDHVFKMKQNKFKLKFKIADSVHTYNCVVNSLCWAGFQQTDGANWNLMWSAPLKPETLRNYDMYKHNNHFPGTWQLGRKDLMYRNISAQMREWGEEYAIVPKTWILPYDLRIFQKERDEHQGKMLWILKPAASACGRGIKILSKQSSLPKKGAYVVNQYIMKPHLIGGFKYDLRLYVLVTSFEPLTIYIHEDGLVRFATQPYTTKNRKSRFAHLTNFSVNKKATNYKKAGKDQVEENSSKWRLKTLKNAFKAQGLSFEDVWDKIKDLVVKAVISVEPVLANNLNRASRNRHLCFEVFGFDVIIDHNLKPWLLEVNVLPSLSSSSQLDKRVKTSLMTDVFSTIGIVPYNKKKFERAQDTAYWKRFSGLGKRAAPPNMAKKAGNGRGNADDGLQQQYFGLDDPDDQAFGLKGNAHSANQGPFTANRQYGNANQNQKEEDKAIEESEEENLAWERTQHNMAQSQSNYLQSKIRSVKEVASTTDYNIEEQLVIVELCEEYCRRGSFEMIFPRKATVDKYKKYFKVQRACNTIVWKWLKLSSVLTTTVRHTGKSGKAQAGHAESNKELPGASNDKQAAVGPKTRFSVLKDFQVRKNCSNRYIEDIKKI